MNWQILLTISILTFSVSTVLQRILLRGEESDPIAYTIVFQLFNGALIGLFAVLNGFKLPPSLQPILGNLFLTVILYASANVFIFKSLKVTEASEFTVLFATRTIWTILAAIIFLGESFSSQQVVGTLLIILSVVLVSWKTRKIHFGTGEQHSLLAAALFGLAFTNDAFIIQRVDVLSYVSLAFIFPAILIWVINPKSTKKMKIFFRKEVLLKMIILTIFYSVSAITIFEAYNLGRNAAQIAPLNQTAIILTVIMASVFLKERTHLVQKICGAILSFVGVILLIR